MDEVMAPIQTPLSLGASVTIDPVHVAGMRDSPPGESPPPATTRPSQLWAAKAGPGHVASAEAMSAAATGVPMGVGFAYGVIPADSQSELGMQTSAVRETISSGVAPVPLTKTSSNKQPVIYMEC
eukprot:CAMPEP_0175982352 /NCGR_PEP_ID=MMETSP0108-20121206/47854_1 /TAXON_ID=195067 ORGANISM="Goniomonas pacifica, Strain CCMP1869" /NCGR_SAMPLE_ID=MMETSP0108 /ASSEMBLY_ACC=CAM_ASM_000204 /LENGTH=124 /DNA_ID=CAMNT_0017313005 /DNA_START=45 /DNA_END=420 /DNA_ORIENTATION=+